MRKLTQLYPDYTAEIDAIEQNGITPALLERIIAKHQGNACYNRDLCNRYQVLDGFVPISDRKPRFGDETDRALINHKINNDFFGEIVDFKTGYMAGRAIAYGYSDTVESLEETADVGDTMQEAKYARDAAAKAITDFVTRNNMYDVDMETTKLAAIAGYCGRLFYIDTDGNECVRVVPPYETIILSKNGDITQPEFGVRYYLTMDIHDYPVAKAEFYDASQVTYYEGSLNSLTETGSQEHLFDFCPLQGVPNNREMLGDAEKVLSEIDAYDRALSDASNEIDSFANAYMVYEGVDITEEEAAKAQKSGVIVLMREGGKVSFLTKNINDAQIEHHLDRLEDNIYRFSQTPNLSDETFGTASGVALKFKLTGLEAKCGMFQAKLQSAGVYMFKLLASSWAKKQIKVDPLQCTMDFKRNFPLDILSEAQAATALISAGLPKRVAYQLALSGIDDIEYVMQLIEEEKEGIPSLMQDLPEDDRPSQENETTLVGNDDQS